MAQELGWLERFALRYLERRYGASPSKVGTDEVHVLNAEERAELRKIELGVVFRAALIGAVTAGLAALVEVDALALLGEDPDAAPMDAHVDYWLIVGPAIGIAAVVEIALLYWDSLRSVHLLARAAGLPLFQEEPRGTALALARAALELPNPRQVEGRIDAHRETSKLWMLTVGLLYKAKVGLTSFLLKALVRRAAGRALVRAWLVWLAVPVTAAWDAIVAWMVIREARIRAMGPSAARELADALFPVDGSRPQLSEHARVVAHMAVGGSIVSNHDCHPNLLALLRALDDELGETPTEVPLDDTSIFKERFTALEAAEQQRVLEVQVVAAIMDGRISRGEKKLIETLQQICGRQGLGGIHRLRRRFVAGHPLTVADVEQAIGEPRG